MSGTAQSQLLSALRFLGLVETDRTTTDTLKALADSYNTANWKSQLKELLTGAYAKTIGDLDLRGATPPMLRERFRTHGGVDGGTIENAMRFYLSGLKEAEVPFSAHLVMRQRAPRNTGVRPRRGAGTVLKTDLENGPDLILQTPEGTFEISFKILGVPGQAYLPDDVSLEQWDVISGYVKTVIGYRQQAPKARTSV